VGRCVRASALDSDVYPVYTAAPQLQLAHPERIVQRELSTAAVQIETWAQEWLKGDAYAEPLETGDHAGSLGLVLEGAALCDLETVRRAHGLR
jgi:hypothetical protein